MPGHVSSRVPRCQALTGRGTRCQRPAVNGGPCAWHDPRRKPAPRAWPLARRWKLLEGIERGQTDEQIGRALGVSADAVKLARRRYHLPGRIATTPTAREVGRRLGVGCAKTVSRWVQAGYLRGRQAYRIGPNRVWLIKESAVLDFLANPEHWHRYDVDYIADPDWKAYALGCRGDVRLLRVGEAAHLAFVEIGTMSQWIRKGWLPARKRGPNWFIRSDDLAVALDRRERTGSAAIEPAVLELRERLGVVA